MLFALVAVGLTMAVAAPVLMDVVMNSDASPTDEDEVTEEAPEAEEGDGAAPLGDLLLGTEMPEEDAAMPPDDDTSEDEQLTLLSYATGHAPDLPTAPEVPLAPTDPDMPDVPPDTGNEGAIGPADPDAPDAPAGTGDDGVLSPTDGNAPEVAPATEGSVAAIAWDVPIEPGAAPSEVEDFRPGDDVLVVLVSRDMATLPGVVDVAPEDGDGIVSLNSQPIAVLKQVEEASMSDLHLLTEDDPLTKLLGGG